MRNESTCVQKVRRRPPAEIKVVDRSFFGSVNQRITSAIFLDPSINNIGWAIYHYGKLLSGCIRTQGETLEAKLYSLKTQLEELLDKYAPARAMVEYPPSFTYSRSKSAQSQKGLNLESLIKLSLATGVCLSSCAAGGAITEPIEATWKGPCNKEYAIAVTGKTNEHEADACLLRMWFLARNNPVKRVV